MMFQIRSGFRENKVSGTVMEDETENHLGQYLVQVYDIAQEPTRLESLQQAFITTLIDQ